MAISAQASRFALLKIEDDYSSDDDNTTSSKDGAKSDPKSENSKKKNKRKNKKGAQSKAQDEQLKSLAFGMGGGKKNAAQQQQNGHPALRKGTGDATNKQWDEWQKADTEVAAESYEKDLQQALLMSKIEQEQSKGGSQGGGASQNNHDASNGSAKNKKKNKKKDKPQAMSIDQFNLLEQTLSRKSQSEDPEYEILPAPAKLSTALPAEADPEYFKKVQQDTQKILRKEQIQEEYRKQYLAEGATVVHLRSEIEKRDQEIKQLRTDNKGLTDIMFLFQDELKQVKKRNQQLCHILSQGEMKDKAAVQLELEELQVSHQELTEQVTELTEQLEKARSKGHGFKSELDKMKGGKHGK